MNDTLIAVDLGKDIFEIAVSHRPGKVAECYRPRRAKLLAFFAQRPKATVIMEACGSAHHRARKIQQLGHDVVLLPPHLVKPYVRRNKTDRADAKGLLEAYRNEQIRPVPVKTVQQHTLTMLHRLRSEWMVETVARMNALRGLLRELGLIISYLGITPREFSSGSRRHLGRISKMGDVYVRMLLIHGARSVLMHAKRMVQVDRLRQWALEVEKRTNHNKAATALANKLARVIWAVWKDHREFQVIPVAA